MKHNFTIFAVKWREHPFVRLCWTTKDLDGPYYERSNRLRVLLDYFAIVQHGNRTENLHLQDFLKNNCEIIDNTTVADIEYIKVQSYDADTLDLPKVKAELDRISKTFTDEGYIVLNFNRYKVRLPKRKAVSEKS